MKRLTVLLLIGLLLIFTGEYKMTLPGLTNTVSFPLINSVAEGTSGLAGLGAGVSNSLSSVLGQTTGDMYEGSMRYNDGVIQEYRNGQWITATPATDNTGGGGTARANTASDEQAYYDQQIADLDRLLGRTSTAESQGLQSLQDSAAEQKRLIEEQRTKANNTYDSQRLETDQSKERGFGQVNDFANTSYRNLMRLFQGGNAGGGSAAKQLMPSLVSKSAGTRRQGVIDQAGTNYKAIDSAKADAATQFDYNSQDIENQRKNQERDFLLGIGNQRNSLDTQKGQLQVQKAQASGQGYAQARSAADASRNSVDSRQAQLDALFGTYKPQYTARATNLQTPTLGKYTVDPAQFGGNQNLSVDSRYYGSQLGQLKKKQQEGTF